jgi:4-phytase/acid phosphatase
VVSVTTYAQPSASSPDEVDAELRFVVFVSRHGVRSPTGKNLQYDTYSAAPWPKWDVAPGYLTAHGFHLMELFGAYDRMKLASQGLFHANGCEDAAGVTIYADSDQRTRETGKALAQGMFPGCGVSVQFLPEGSNDPLFHPVPANAGPLDAALASAAIAGRIGGSPDNLTHAYRTQIASLDNLLANCGAATSAGQKRTSLFDIPAAVSPGTGDHLADAKGPINTASTLSENLLLEYAEGMEVGNVGWGCVDGPKLRELMELHTAATDFTQRTPVVAKIQASNLLDHIDRALEQAATGKPIHGAPGKPADRALFLIGHDTNLENIAGLLNLNWIVDGRRDDTPPGSALIFELWRERKSGNYFVRTYFTAQTLEQMRLSTPLTSANPPERIPVFIPSCSREDFSCAWPAFSTAVRQVVDPRNVIAK